MLGLRARVNRSYLVRDRLRFQTRKRNLPQLRLRLNDRRVQRRFDGFVRGAATPISDFASSPRRVRVAPLWLVHVRRGSIRKQTVRSTRSMTIDYRGNKKITI